MALFNTTQGIDINGNLYVKGTILEQGNTIGTPETFILKNDLYLDGNLIVNGKITWGNTKYLPLKLAIFPATLNYLKQDVVINGNLVVSNQIYNSLYIPDYPYPWFDFKGIKSYSNFINPVISPNIVKSAPRFETIEIPGRNGALYFEWGDYATFDLTIECWFDFQKISFADVGQYLSGEGNLIIDVSPDFYYKAKIMDIIDMARIIETFRQFSVKFKCQPFAYFNTNIAPISVTASPTTLNNPGTVYSQPLLTIQGSGSGNIIITPLGTDVYNLGTQTLTISNITNNMIIDCENYIAYYNLTNLSNEINIFPVLPPGAYKIEFTGGITSFDILPNYRNIC